MYDYEFEAKGNAMQTKKKVNHNKSMLQGIIPSLLSFLLDNNTV